MRPNFKDIDIKNAGFAATNAAEWAKANGIEGDAVYDTLKAEVTEVNKSLPSYARVADVRVMKEEFEKTPKHSIKRFLYQK